MYAVELVKKTALAKKLGGPPVFHDGHLTRILIDADTVAIDIRILSKNNPRLRKDTPVRLRLGAVDSFRFECADVGDPLMVVHDLDIRKEDDDKLRMLLESARGEISEIVFETIELVDIDTT